MLHSILIKFVLVVLDSFTISVEINFQLEHTK